MTDFVAIFHHLAVKNQGRKSDFRLMKANFWLHHPSALKSNGAMLVFSWNVIDLFKIKTNLRIVTL